MKKIGIMIDTASDMPKEYIDRYDLREVNFMVTFGDESLIAREEISEKEFFEKVNIFLENFCIKNVFFMAKKGLK